MKRFLKGLLFYPMMFLRGPILIVLRLFSALCMFYFLAALVGTIKRGMTLTNNYDLIMLFVSLGVGAFSSALSFNYDRILLHLQPDDTSMIL